MPTRYRDIRIHRPLPVVPLVAAVLAVVLLAADRLQAEVVRVVIDRREVVLDGQSWGEHGAYEKLVGRVYFAFDPGNPANASIVDLQRAPRNSDGRVEAWSEFMVLQPRDPDRRRGVAWLEVSNRGSKASLRYFNRASSGGWDPTSEEDFGDGLLMRQGLTIIWVGWQWDVPEQEGLLRLHVPVARGDAEEKIEGLVRADWVVEAPADTLDLGHRGHRVYPPVAAEHPDHVLTVRDGRESSREVVPAEQWKLVPEPRGPEARLSRIVLEGGFEAGKIYELVYRAENPRVVGLGLAAVRDMMSYARYGLNSEFPAQQGVAFGVSQTGRFLRHFLYEGFNVDEGGRKVFDGMLVHTAGAGRGSFNHRFAQPSRDGHPYSAFFYPTDLYPFSSRAVPDPLTGRQEGLQDAVSRENRPKIFYTNTGYEYWGRAASLLHTGVRGQEDLPPLENERIYHLASGQHFVGEFPTEEMLRTDAPVLYRSNPLDFLLTLRALAVRLVEWVEEDRAPPASAYPTLGEGTLVPPAGVALPPIPGLERPRTPHVAYRADYGPRFEDEGVVTNQPPELGDPFPSLVSQVDGLGNEMGGLRALEIRVPLATFTPWNLRGPDAPSSPDALSDFVGTFVPLPRTEEERADWGDPRPSVEALYGSRGEYMRRVVAAVQDLVSRGILLPEDGGHASRQAAQAWDRLMGAPHPNPAGEPLLWAPGAPEAPGDLGAVSQSRKR